MTQKEKLFNYLMIRGYEKKYAEVYREMREELKALGIKDASKVTEVSYRLMSLRQEIQDLVLKIRNECKFFGFDMETEVNDLILEFFTNISETIDEEIPLG